MTRIITPFPEKSISEKIRVRDEDGTDELVQENTPAKKGVPGYLHEIMEIPWFDEDEDA